MNTNHSSLRVTNKVAEVERIEKFVSDFCTQHLLVGDLRSAFRLCLEEVFVNIVSYAYPDGGEHAIDIQLTLGANEVMAEVSDEGQPFDPLNAPEPNLAQPVAEMSMGGMGILLVRRVMDRVEYVRDGDRNRLTLRRTIKQDWSH